MIWTAEYIIALCLAILWLYQLYFWLRYLAAPLHYKPKFQEESKPIGVSVIVCARNEQCNLTDYLQALLMQDYPLYEVIVVDDSSEDATHDMLIEWTKVYPRLKTTFVPKGANVISTKKLALTLGAKAAHYDYLLLIDADCRPETKHWISEMVRGFAQHPNGARADIVLGVGLYFRRPGMLNRMICFDTMFSALQYTGFAIHHKPYMGIGRNLAYSKRLFFEQGGFSKILEYRSGDDDLFVNRAANRLNTEVITTPYSITWSSPKMTWKEWLFQKRRHLSVSSAYSTQSKRRIGFEPLTRAMFYVLAILLCTTGSWQLQLLTGALFLLRWIWQAIILNCAASKWGTRKHFLLIPLWETLLPIVTLFILVNHKIRKQPLRQW